jgi:ATP-independent RNA helicase DbpA
LPGRCRFVGLQATFPRLTPSGFLGHEGGTLGEEGYAGRSLTTHETALPTDPEKDAALLLTRNWLERAVIGLSLCPFAKAALSKGQIRFVVTLSDSEEALLSDLRRELQALSDADPEEVDTTLLILPRVLGDFLDYNDFLKRAASAVEAAGLAGKLQIASFHPQYVFADLDADDIANATNRSPYPILHLLREASVSRAVESFPEAATIFERNVARLRELGHDGLQRVLSAEPKPSVPPPSEFAALPLSPSLSGVAAELGFEKLTAIQAESMPPLLAGRDLIGQSATGSGKTVAFALPLLERLDLGTQELQGLVLTPTRELAAQVARELRRLGRRQPGLSVALLSGGEPVREQTRALERGAHLAVGTPGRVLDHLRRRTLRVHRVATIVLDEADRMLDMGFQPDIERVLKALPSSRQVVLFSATFPEAIRELSKKYQKHPVSVRVDAQTKDKPDIVELVLRTPEGKKLDALRWALRAHPHESALVFANQKVTVAALERALVAQGVSVSSLHGDLEQRDRDRVMAKFRNGSTRVLLATDVASRGIDLDNLSLVINLDLPSQPEVYVHRIGRTGRAGKSGLAISLCAPADEPKLEAIEEYTGRALTEVEPEPHGPGRPDSAHLLGAGMDTLRLSGGRKDKLRAGDILGALTGEAGGLRGADVGKIEIHDQFSFVAVAKAVSQKALESLGGGRIKGRRFRVTRVA